MVAKTVVLRIVIGRRSDVFLDEVVVFVCVCMCVGMKVCRVVVCAVGIIPIFTMVMVVVMWGVVGMRRVVFVDVFVDGCVNGGHADSC